MNLRQSEGCKFTLILTTGKLSVGMTTKALRNGLASLEHVKVTFNHGPEIYRTPWHIENRLAC